MGWGIDKSKRDIVTANARALERTPGGRRYANVHGQLSRQLPQAKSTRHIVWPAAGHRAFGDAPALIRSNATGLMIQYSHDRHMAGTGVPRTAAGRSAIQVATSVLNGMLESSPGQVDVFFDLADAAAFPPQRAEVAAKRGAQNQMPAEKVAALVAQFRCASVKDVVALDPAHLPLLETRNIDWAAVFNVRTLKPWAWLVYQNALKVVAVRKAATVDDLVVRIWCTDGSTQHAVTKRGVKTSVVHLEYDYGEADLRVFFAAANAAIAGANVVVHSIDTDFFTLAMAATWFEPATTVMLKLKHDVYNLRDFIGDRNTVERLNAAFWMVSFGSDYSNSLTNNGYLTKGLCSLLQDPVGAGPYAVADNHMVFKAADALGVLAGLKRHKKTKPPPKTLEQSLLDMHFCVCYYGFHFDGSYPALADDAAVAHTVPLHVR